MKTTSTCPKCNGTEIYSDEGQTKSGDRSSIPISNWSRLFVSTYICSDCGYIEEFIENNDLKDAKKMAKLKENWKKHQR